MTYQLFIGIDTGSEKLDYHIFDAQEVEYRLGQFENKQSSILNWANQLLANDDLLASQILVCIENTGVYSLRMAYELHLLGFAVWLQDAFQIKQSIGRTRSKTDKLDALRIARYALRNQADFQPFVPSSKVLSSLTALSGQRKRFLKAANQLRNGIGETIKYTPKDIVPEQDCFEPTQAILDQIKQSIKAVDKKIKELIKQDERYARTMEILMSQPGVGKVTALELILQTKNFAHGYDPKKLASLVGVAPHRYESGKSVFRKSRTQKSTDKKVKSCLYLGMLRLSATKGKMYEYYQRKQAEGKHHNSIINAMANITIRTICACMKKDVMYDKKFKHHLQVS